MALLLTSSFSLLSFRCHDYVQSRAAVAVGKCEMVFLVFCFLKMYSLKPVFK